MDNKANQRVLSIQSSVVFGYVGNKCSVFALQLLGFDVDPVHTVQLSNHSGYEICKGLRTSGEEFQTIMAGLRENNFLQHYSDLITGYFGNESLLLAFADFLDQWRLEHPKLNYVCDPVFGDDEKLYNVPPSLVDIYRDRIINHASMVTPNQTEAQFLSGIKITSLQTAKDACSWFHARGIPTVIITSLKLPEVNEDQGQQQIHALGSTLLPRDDDDAEPTTCELCHLTFPGLDASFSGTGDLCTALLMANGKRNPDASIEDILVNVMATLHDVVTKTYEAKSRELLLVACKNSIENPPVAAFRKQTTVQTSTYAISSI